MKREPTREQTHRRPDRQTDRQTKIIAYRVASLKPIKNIDSLFSNSNKEKKISFTSLKDGKKLQSLAALKVHLTTSPPNTLYIPRCLCLY